jgi:hypothetical protein
MTRWILFFITIGLGAAGGMFYGWWVNPVKNVETGPSALRADYKVDYVLMVAEAYQGEQNLSLAASRLALLGDENPVESVATAIEIATTQIRYSEPDVAVMRSLAEALESWSPAQGVTNP